MPRYEVTVTHKVKLKVEAEHHADALRKVRARAEAAGGPWTPEELECSEVVCDTPYGSAVCSWCDGEGVVVGKVIGLDWESEAIEECGGCGGFGLRMRET